jgi:hypothetical protein
MLVHGYLYELQGGWVLVGAFVSASWWWTSAGEIRKRI